MKYLFFLGLLCLTNTSINAQVTNEQLLGKWIIDLRPTPEAEAYYQSFEITKIKENKLNGTFYGSEIKNGFINSNWDRIYFAFSTSDGSYDYYHSGYLLDGKLYGMSYCPGRSFMAPWSGQIESE